MGRPIHSNIPRSVATLTPQWPYLDVCHERNEQMKENQRHGTRPLPPIPNDTPVLVTNNGNQIEVLQWMLQDPIW